MKPREKASIGFAGNNGGSGRADGRVAFQGSNGRKSSVRRSSDLADAAEQKRKAALAKLEAFGKVERQREREKLKGFAFFPLLSSSKTNKQKTQPQPSSSRPPIRTQTQERPS